MMDIRDGRRVEERNEGVRKRMSLKMRLLHSWQPRVVNGGEGWSLKRWQEGWSKSKARGESWKRQQKCGVGVQG